MKAVCTMSESTITLHGGTGSRRKPFVVHLPSLGIEQATFYLDGHKLKTLKSSQAKNGQFSDHDQPEQALLRSAQAVSVKTVMTDPDVRRSRAPPCSCTRTPRGHPRSSPAEPAPPYASWLAHHGLRGGGRGLVTRLEQRRAIRLPLDRRTPVAQNRA